MNKIIEIIEYLIARWRNRDSLKTFGAARNSEWPRVRAEHLQIQPACAVCGKSPKGLTDVHHKEPFHINPELELLESNLITLCETHHLWWGHLGNFRSWNVDVEQDAKIWNDKILRRPSS